jgi:HAD superfamily hydrolase (TIGR01509 family)
MLSALIFDVDGTLADTEAAHRDAFNAAFAEAGLGWHWDELLYTRLLGVAGGKERILHYWKTIDPQEAGGRMAQETVDAVHRIKTRHYETMVRGGRISLRPGILRLICEAHAHSVPMAIASTTTPANIEALLHVPLGSGWRSLFAAVCDASTAANKKPAPDVYLAALDALALPPDACLAFEDSENGLRAARAAGIPTLVTPTAYTAGHRFDDALLILPYLGDPDHPLPQHIPGADQRWADLAALRRWHHGTLFEAA